MHCEPAPARVLVTVFVDLERLEIRLVSKSDRLHLSKQPVVFTEPDMECVGLTAIRSGDEVDDAVAVEVRQLRHEGTARSAAGDASGGNFVVEPIAISVLAACRAAEILEYSKAATLVFAGVSGPDEQADFIAAWQLSEGDVVRTCVQVFLQDDPLTGESGLPGAGILPGCGAAHSDSQKNSGQYFLNIESRLSSSDHACPRIKEGFTASYAL